MQPADDTDTADLEDLVELHLYYRRSGPRGSGDPYGTRKVTVLQPRNARNLWRQAVQYRVPHHPNITAVFDGEPLNPRVRSDAASSEDEGEVTALDFLEDANAADLEITRARLRVEIQQLDAQVREKRAHAVAEEAHLDELLARQRESLTKAREQYDAEASAHHEKLLRLQEQEGELLKAMDARIEAMDSDLTDRLVERRERVREIEEIVRNEKEGSTSERLIDRALNRVDRASEGPLGAILMFGIAKKLGLSPDELGSILGGDGSAG